MEITRSKLAIILTCLVLSAVRATVASSYPYSSQFLSPQRANSSEQVILLKLPGLISPQIQEQYQPRQQAFYDPAQQRALLMVTSDDEQRQLDESAIEEHSAVLTIPLSTLNNLQAKPETHYAGQQVKMAPSDYPSETRLSQMQILPQSEQQQTVESSREHISLQQVQQLNSLISALAANVPQVPTSYPGEPQLYQQQSPRQATSNLTSSVEQQLRQLISQHADLYGNGPTSSAGLNQVSADQPHLWRDTQLDQQEDAVQTSQVSQLESSHASDATSSLLNKLASSSPDLLLRLRALLRRAGQQRPDSRRNLTSLGAPTAKSIYSDSDDTTHNDEALKYLSTLRDQHGRPAFSGKPSMLDTFLTSNNLSSHEEIKIPLVVIAMPRILSLKRNQQLAAGSQNKPTHPSNSSVVSLIQQFIKPVYANLTQSGVGNSSTGNGTSSHQLVDLDGPPASYSTTNNPTESNLSPYMYMTGEGLASSGAGSDQAQEPARPSSNAQHTMAPYAHQFSVPSIGAPKRAQYDQQPYLIGQQNGRTTLIKLQRGPARAEDYQSSSRPIEESPNLVRPLIDLIVARSNGTASTESSGHRASSQPNGNDYQFQLVERAGAGGDLQNYSARNHLMLYTKGQPSPNQPLQLAAMKNPPFTPIQPASISPEQLLEQRTYSPTSSKQTNGTGSYRSLAGEAYANQPLAGYQKELYPASAGAGVRSIEDRLARLRPLFYSANRRFGNPRTVSDGLEEQLALAKKLSPRQIAGYLGRIRTARRPAEAGEQQDLHASSSDDQPAAQRIEIKKSPKMMVMIVRA